MSEMIERVARAMCWGYKLNCHRTDCPHAGECMAEFDPRDGLMVMAKLSIAALREPTKAMAECGHSAGWSGCIDGDKPCEEEAATLLWQAMVDAALK